MNHGVGRRGKIGCLLVNAKFFTQLQTDKRSHHFGQTSHFSDFVCRFLGENLIVLTVNYAKGFA